MGKKKRMLALYAASSTFLHFYTENTKKHDSGQDSIISSKKYVISGDSFVWCSNGVVSIFNSPKRLIYKVLRKKDALSI